MESKAKAVRVSIILTALSIFFTVLTYNRSELLFTIFSGLFASTVVTMIIYVTEYSVVKKQCLERYWIAANEEVQLISNIKIFTYDNDTSELQKRLMDCFNDDQKILWLHADFDGKIDPDIAEVKKNAIEVMKSYITVADHRLSDLENAYGDIFFVLPYPGNQKRKWIYENIHKPLRDLHNEIVGECYHFKSYLNGEQHNLAVMIDKILKLQKKIFRTEYKKNDIDGSGKFLFQNYYNEVADHFSNILEDFRSKAVYHCEREEQSSFLRLSRYLNRYMRKYIDYFTLLHDGKIEEAKTVHDFCIPSLLTKFYPLGDDDNKNKLTLDTLEKNELWFSAPKKFNDPYEFHGVYFDKKKLKDAGYPDYAVKGYADAFDNKSAGVCCFTENDYNYLPMWAYYTNNYQGYCVEYAVRRPDLFYPVVYEDKRIPIASLVFQWRDAIRNGDVVKGEFLREVLKFGLYFKDKTWEHEREYRMLCPIDEGSDGAGLSCDIIGLKPVKIITGYNCTDANFQELSRIARRLGLKKIYKAKLSDDQFGFETEEILL